MKAVLAILVLVIAGYFIYAAMKPASKSKETGTGMVYYYPKTNVYYDVATAQYVYFDEKENGWKQSKNFSEEQKLSLGEKAVIENPSSPVWKNNAQDRLVYSVNVYSSRNDLRQKFETDSLSSLPPPRVADTPKTSKPEEQPAEEKPKSGLKKFLEKIFKGREKNKDS